MSGDLELRERHTVAIETDPVVYLWIDNVVLGMMTKLLTPLVIRLIDLAATCGAEAHTACLMDKPTHLLAHTLQANLRCAMRQINGVSTPFRSLLPVGRAGSEWL